MTFRTSTARLQAATRTMSATRRGGLSPVAPRHADEYSKVIAAQLSSMYRK